MRYFYRDQNSREVGPYTMDELCQLHLSGVVRPEMEIVEEGTGHVSLFRDLWAGARRTRTDEFRSDAASGKSRPPPVDQTFTRKTTEDFRALVPHLLVPLRELKTFQWFENRKLLSVAAIGLLPLFIIAVFSDYGDIKSAYWAIAFYFSALWALFFYYVFPAPDIKISTCALSFFGTGLISISMLILVYNLVPIGSFLQSAQSKGLLTRALVNLLAIGLPEETCKALVLFFIARRVITPLPPQSMMFYGLMAGLGFGIYEGVNYQTHYNLSFSQVIGHYYLLNVLRLTTLPFLHAVWAGIAGYFIGFAYLYPERKRGLLITAIGLPALFHGLYNTFVGTPIIGLGVALLSVMALTLYLAKSVDIEKALGNQR